MPMLGRYKLWTVSNLMSLSRILLTIPIVLFLLDDTPKGRYWAILFMWIAVLTDFFDGYIARRMDQVTDLGKIMDPLADKIAVTAVVIVLVSIGSLPLWFAAAVVIRDILIFIGGLYAARKKGRILEANQPGKWAVTVIVLTIVFATLDARLFDVLLAVLMGLCVLMLLISLALYLKRFRDVLRADASAGR